MDQGQPTWKRWALRPVPAWLTLAALILGLAIGSGSSSSDPATAGPQAQPEAVVKSEECLPVGEAFRRVLRAPATDAVRSADTFDTGRTVWYVAAEDGATWATTGDPTAEDDSGGLTLPLNWAARTSSDLGADASEDAPIFGEVSEDAEDALLARECARG